MKTNIATNPDQTARLLKCGVPAESADMYWDNHTLDEPLVNVGEITDKRDVPAFSLSALLGLLPKVIKTDSLTTYKLNIDYPPIGEVAIRYNTEDDEFDSLFGLMGDDLFELIVLLIERLTANYYKLNEIEKGGSHGED